MSRLAGTSAVARSQEHCPRDANVVVGLGPFEIADDVNRRIAYWAGRALENADHEASEMFVLPLPKSVRAC